MLFAKEKCDGALGSVIGKQLISHTAWNDDNTRARLNLSSGPQGWRAQKNGLFAWLDIDLLLTRTVTAVATQGYGNEEAKEWVKTYVLMTSQDGIKWKAYREKGRKRVRLQLTLHTGKTSYKERLYMLWFNFILVQNFISFVLVMVI